jgi:hypothetical protein
MPNFLTQPKNSTKHPYFSSKYRKLRLFSDERGNFVVQNGLKIAHQI